MAAPPSGVNLALLDKLVAALSAKGLVTEAEIAERQAISPADPGDLSQERGRAASPARPSAVPPRNCGQSPEAGGWARPFRASGIVAIQPQARARVIEQKTGRRERIADSSRWSVQGARESLACSRV